MARSAIRNHALVQIAELVIDKYQRDNVGGLAAALAYFTIFAIFPLLLVVTSLVGFVLDPTRYNIQAMLLNLIGSPEVRELVAQTLNHFSETRLGTGIFGIATLFFAATGIFGSLMRTFKLIWGTRLIAESGNLKTAVTVALLNRLIAFALLFGVAALIMVAVLGNLVIALLVGYTDWVPLNGLLLRLAQRMLTLVLITIAFATLYKVLPGSLPQWRDVWPAALIAAAAFTLVQELAELIFGLTNFSSFGVLGGAMTLLLWIYISSQILLVGGEISYAWAYVLGSQKGKLPGETTAAAM